MKTGNIWLICREPVHIGGADSENRGNNNPIYRLPDRTPVIPGSSLRGALREHAEKTPSLKNTIREWFGGNTQLLRRAIYLWGGDGLYGGQYMCWDMEIGG